MDFSELVSARYSCKKYNGVQISESQLNEILEAGRLAPTAKNGQEQHIYVLRSAEALAKVDELTPCRYNAPTVLMVAFDATKTYHYPDSERESGIEDASIVATHLMLAAKNAGVESCWVNFFNPEQAKQLFELPDEEEILMLLDLGFAAEEGGPLANHESRKSLTETVTYL